MVGLDHGPAHADETHDEQTSVRNARMGMKLFLIYLAAYLGYVLLTAFRPETMKSAPVGGINLAVLYGLGLIVGAGLVAVVYGRLCRTKPNDDR